MKRKRWYLFLMVVLLLFSSYPLLADSLWQETSSSPYTTEKAFKVGDLITVLILETTSAEHKSDTGTSVKDDLSAKLYHNINTISNVVPTGTNNLTGTAKNVYQGSGQTERSSQVKAKIAVIVKDILKSGNLKIEGNHKVRINEETQEVLISGVVRPKDVTLENTVYSYQVAQADIEIKGKGVVDSGAEPGWFVRFINWLF